MAWAITISGEDISWRTIAGAEQLLPGERYATEDPTNKAYDSGTDDFRGPTNAELLVKAKRRAWVGVKYRRQQELDAGVDYNGHLWDSGERYINEINRALTSWARARALTGAQQALLPAPVPTTVSWTTAADIEVTLTFMELLLLDSTLNNHRGTIFGIAKQLRTAIINATTTEEVNAVAWP